MSKPNVLKEKSFAFAVRIVKLNQYLVKEHRDYILSKQILRSGTAIRALVRESEYGSTKKDFIYKLTVALKEASETQYWLDLLNAAGFITVTDYKSIVNDCQELLKILTASIKTSKANNA